LTETVLVDTSALYAYLDAADEQHTLALDRMRRLLDSVAANDSVALTHSAVVVESVALIQRRLGMNAVRDLVDVVMGPMMLRFVDADLHNRAVTALLAAGRRDISLVDWTSFELMRELRIDHALAFDDDFADQGFELYG
jgi:uncharacterized protein